MITSVTIRGQEFDVEYRDHGYEPDTGAHEIDWHFTEADAPKDLTAEEEELVYLQLVQIEPMYFEDDVI